MRKKSDPDKFKQISQISHSPQRGPLVQTLPALATIESTGKKPTSRDEKLPRQPTRTAPRCRLMSNKFSDRDDTDYCFGK